MERTIVSNKTELYELLDNTFNEDKEIDISIENKISDDISIDLICRRTFYEYMFDVSIIMPEEIRNQIIDEFNINNFDTSYIGDICTLTVTLFENKFYFSDTTYGCVINEDRESDINLYVLTGGSEPYLVPNFLTDNQINLIKNECMDIYNHINNHMIDAGIEIDIYELD